MYAGRGLGQPTEEGREGGREGGRRRGGRNNSPSLHASEGKKERDQKGRNRKKEQRAAKGARVGPVGLIHQLLELYGINRARA